MNTEYPNRYMTSINAIAATCQGAIRRCSFGPRLAFWFAGSDAAGRYVADFPTEAKARKARKAAEAAGHRQISKIAAR